MKTFQKKILPQYFKAVADGSKMFELRLEFGASVGDTLILREWDERTLKYTGREIVTNITYVLRDVPEYGLMPGFCVLGIKKSRNSRY